MQPRKSRACRVASGLDTYDALAASGTSIDLDAGGSIRFHKLPLSPFGTRHDAAILGSEIHESDVVRLKMINSTRRHLKLHVAE